MSARRPLVIAIFLLAAGAPVRPARAQDAGAAVVSSAAAAELTSLEAELTRAAAQLSSGCVTACPALASMERAASRICALDPGPRCTEARAKVRDAARRVQQACGECRLREERAGEKPPEKPAPPSTPLAGLEAQGKAAPPPPQAPPQPPPPPPAEAAMAAPRAAEPQAAVHRGGGCAGCAVADGDREALGAGLLAAVALAALGVRGRSRRRR